MKGEKHPKIRRMEILERLKEKQGTGEDVSIQKLASRFRVNAATIRNDLKILQRLAPIERFHGGARLQDSWLTCSGGVFMGAMQADREAKSLLAAYVVRYLIDTGDTLMLDMGSTLTVFAAELTNSGIGGLRVASHSISAPLQFMESAIDYIQLGGRLHIREPAALPIDDMPEDWFPWHVPYKALMTAESFSIENGAATSDPQIARLDQRYMADAGEVIMIMDHSKFSEWATSTSTMCGLAPEKTDWLSKEKSFTLVTEVQWDGKGEAEEYRKLVDRITPNIPKDRDFSSIRVFESTLKPK